jgi:oligopeptide/dipeptide ABC transporter ATP-binding protein
MTIIAPAGRTSEYLLDIRGLRTYFHTQDGVVKAVDGVDFSVRRGEIVGLVGESGCGKSVTSLSVLRLIAYPGVIAAGEILFDGTDLLKLPRREMTHIRGSRISMIFQQPTSCLNPVFDIGFQVEEVLAIHRKVDRSERRERAIELLQIVGIPDAEKRVDAFPHELSGGQAQRTMIAMALACDPELLIADEPTTALDVTIQAQILDLMRKLQSQTGTAIILITHDLGIVADMASRVAVMYAGRIVEEAGVRAVFHNPLHPYTQGLLASVPVLGQVKEELDVIPGIVPNLINLPPGCTFAPRCRPRVEKGLTICTEREPDLSFVPGDREHKVRCWLYFAP